VFTIGQKVSIEFRNYGLKNQYYDFTLMALPFAILLTLFGTISRKNKRVLNWSIAGVTIMATVFCFYFLLTAMFVLGFGEWTTEAILYRRNDNSDITVEKQIFDIGALGYGGHRTVQLTPCLKYFQIVKEVDTTNLNKTEWIHVNEEINSHDY
jgi:hypothetical protein